jgi:hypothetical protein
MPRIHLQSTLLNAATYQDQTAILELEFRSGSNYRYSDVPIEAYQELVLSESKGQYFNQRICNRYPYTKIPPAPRGTNPGSGLR